MSDNKHTLKVIPFEAITSIKFSGAFYKRIIELYMFTASKLSREDLVKILAAVKENKVKDLPDGLKENGYNLETILQLSETLENAFIEDKSVVDHTIDLPSSDTISSAD